MVGDSQIGKTSLMVKYVEGSFDEDYIQTLGEWGVCWSLVAMTEMDRRQLYGKDDIGATDNHNVFNMGSGGAEGVCEHAAAGVQRCGCDTVHVRPLEKEHP